MAVVSVYGESPTMVLWLSRVMMMVYSGGLVMNDWCKRSASDFANREYGMSWRTKAPQTLPTRGVTSEFSNGGLRFSGGFMAGEGDDDQGEGGKVFWWGLWRMSWRTKAPRILPT
ncbi:hypothetical protein M8C21_001214, partial [Ambrosia artemisiifolia]